jgi:hypothetical protein
MTSADRVRLIDEVEAIRDELVTLQERFADVALTDALAELAAVGLRFMGLADELVPAPGV